MLTVAALFAASLFPSESLALTVGTASGTKVALEAKAAVAAVSAKTLAPREPRPSSSGFVEPMRFDQKLLICNAYPSTSPATVVKNGKEVLAGNDKADIGYQQCQYIQAQLQQHDRLDFGLRDVEVEGSFQVGDLPATDAVLLLVLERHETSSMISFQSFAFPKSSGRKDAQLAVINAFSGNSSMPHLKMEDHIVTGKDIKTKSKRIEQLNFNRVYSVEAGDYEASITDSNPAGGPAAERELERKTKRMVNMAQSGNYVLLRTGGGDFEESLVVFPEPTFRSAAQRHASMAFALTLAFIASMFFA